MCCLRFCPATIEVAERRPLPAGLSGSIIRITCQRMKANALSAEPGSGKRSWNVRSAGPGSGPRRRIRTNGMRNLRKSAIWTRKRKKAGRRPLPSRGGPAFGINTRISRPADRTGAASRRTAPTRNFWRRRAFSPISLPASMWTCRRKEKTVAAWAVWYNHPVYRNKKEKRTDAGCLSSSRAV